MALTGSPDVSAAVKFELSGAFMSNQLVSNPLLSDHLPDPNDPQAWARYVEDFRQSAHSSVEWIAEYLANIRSYPVLPTVNPASSSTRFPPTRPSRARASTPSSTIFAAQILPAVTQWNHPGFMAYFGTTASTPGILAELLIAAMNTNGLHWKTSPAVAELEQVALGWLRQWLGLPPEFFGIIYDTASTSTMHALICAREFAQPESRVEGYRGNLVVYTSEQAHSSVEKGAMAIGIGQKNVRKVPTDAQFRMQAGSAAHTHRGRPARRTAARLHCRHHRHHFLHHRGPGRRVRRSWPRSSTSGCTSIAPTPAPAPCCPSAPNTSRASSAPTPWSPIRTSG